MPQIEILTFYTISFSFVILTLYYIYPNITTVVRKKFSLSHLEGKIQWVETWINTSFLKNDISSTLNRVKIKQGGLFIKSF